MRPGHICLKVVSVVSDMRYESLCQAKDPIEQSINCESSFRPSPYLFVRKKLLLKKLPGVSLLREVEGLFPSSLEGKSFSTSSFL